MLSGIWQDHQGLGAVSTQAHASEIPRVLILMILDIFLKTNQVRYAYAFLMLILGPLGVYFLLQHIFKQKNYSSLGFAPFIGGLVYLFNLGVLQQFVVPLEMFLTHYGFLGWFYLSLYSLFESPKRKKNLLVFILVNFFMSPQAHTSTLFFSHLMMLCVFLITYTFLQISSGKTPFKKSVFSSLVIFTLTIISNLFWLLPNIYFAVNHSSVVKDAKITRLFSQEAFLHNKQYGNIKDVALMKNFLFNWGVHTGNGKFSPLLSVWYSHLDNPAVQAVGYGVFALAVVGILLAFAKRDKLFISFSPLFFLSLFFLFTVNPPLGFLFEFLQENIPLFGEAFRFPFTKISILAVFSYALFAGYTLENLFLLFAKTLPKVNAFYLKSLFTVAFSILLFFYAKPFFTGNLISPYMRVKIPDRYFQMFEYFNTQDDYGRVGQLPIHTLWGWVYYDWNLFSGLGYQGAGFLWFGIKQPLLDREFDRWGAYNEQYYREMSQAVYSQDVPAFEKILAKYKVKWIIFDKSIFDPGKDPKMLFHKEIEELLESSSIIQLDQDFGGGLQVYKVNKEYSLIESISGFYDFSDNISGLPTDPLYFQYGDYANLSGKENFPFMGMVSSLEKVSPDFISEDEENLYLKSPIERTLKSIISSDYFPVRVFAKRSLDSLSVRLEDETFGLSQAFDIPLVNFSPDIVFGFNEEFIPSENFNSMEVDLGYILINPSEGLKFREFSRIEGKVLNEFPFLEACRDFRHGASYGLETIPDGFRFESKSTVSCVTLPLDTVFSSVDFPQGYMVQVMSNITSNKSLTETCIFDMASGLCKNAKRYISDGNSFAFFSDTPLKDAFLRFLNHPLLFEPDISSSEVKNLKITLYAPTREITVPLANVDYGKKPLLGVPRANVLERREGLSSNDFRMCDTGNRDIVSGTVEFSENILRYTTDGSGICDSYYFPNVSHTTGYILAIDARNVFEMPLRICLTNEYSKRCDVYNSLSESPIFEKHYFLVPPMGEGRGYTLNVSNLVFGNTDSSNELRSISFSPVPYDYILGLYDISPDELFISGKDLVVYNQSFEKNWIALCGLRLCPAKHVKVNNWANGWVFEGASLEGSPDASSDGSFSAFSMGKITIIFWPQILQYIGFFALLGTFGWVSLKIIRQKFLEISKLPPRTG